MMNSRGHLPAGQPMQGGIDMGHSPGGGGRRGRGGGGPAGGGGGGGPPQSYHSPYNVYQQPYPQPPAHMTQAAIYPNYVPYGAPPYYMPPQYQNGGQYQAAVPGYPPPYIAPYNNTNSARSPPVLQPYGQPFVPAHQAYGRPPQQSPIVSTPYQAPPSTASNSSIIPPPTPSSTHSSHTLANPPPPLASPTPQTREDKTLYVPLPLDNPAPLPVEVLVVAPPAVVQPDVPSETESNFVSESSPEAESEQLFATETSKPRTLPWFSPNVQGAWPKKAAKSRRRKFIEPESGILELPSIHRDAAVDLEGAAENEEGTGPAATPKAASVSPESTLGQSTIRSDTPSTQQDHPSEDATSTSPTTPSSVQPATSTGSSAAASAHTPKALARPAIPLIPALPKSSSKDAKANESSLEETQPSQTAAPHSVDATSTETANDGSLATAEESESQSATAPVKTAPKLWTGLFARGATPNNASPVVSVEPAGANGTDPGEASNAAAPNTFGMLGSSSVAEALQAFRVAEGEKLAFLEPRGLVNTGNMCYMNSVLQVLIFCIPFYDFLDQVGKKAAHRFKSETPLIDAMIMFMKEYKVIDSAVSAEQLQKRLKGDELERYGEPFTPEFVYDAIRKLKRFDSMERGHQQDAEEFLGFLLEGLHDEAAKVIRAAPASTASTAPNSSLPTPSPSVSSKANDAADESDWLEVGPRQRAAITRSSGYSNVSSPVTKIFGGQLRSEFRVPGKKISVTLEPYQPLQLDIGAPDVRNIVDALRGLTRPETIQGNFDSPHGDDTKATKQVFIESLPPVLILHLKRFQFDSKVNGTVKIWKKVGYPLELEIPKEVFSRQKRNAVLAEGAGLPKYRLIAVVYHHGKNASGGHYTVDVRRQDGREWIRLDDTVIRRLRSEDVAEAGAEEEPSKASTNDYGKKEAASSQPSNRFGAILDEDAGDDDGWNRVAAPVNGGKKWSTVVNGGSPGNAVAGGKNKQTKESVKDNKVAYLLFYERM